MKCSTSFTPQYCYVYWHLDLFKTTSFIRLEALFVSKTMQVKGSEDTELLEIRDVMTL